MLAAMAMMARIVPPPCFLLCRVEVWRPPVAGAISRLTAAMALLPPVMSLAACVVFCRTIGASPWFPN